MALAVLAWCGIGGLHVLRALRHPHAVREDWAHPIRAGFFAAGTIGAMEVAAAFSPWAPGFAQSLLLLAVAAHVGLAVALLARFTRGQGHVDMLEPPLLLPLVGHLMGALFCALLGMTSLGWMLLGVGGLLWLLLMLLVIWRQLSGPGLPATFRPALGIILAPPTVGSLAVVALVGVGPWVLVLYGLSAFILAMLALGLGHILEAGFSPAVWSFTFPLANFAAVTAILAPGAPAWFVLLVVTFIVGLTAVLTILAATGGWLLGPPNSVTPAG